MTIDLVGYGFSPSANSYRQSSHDFTLKDGVGAWLVSTIVFRYSRPISQGSDSMSLISSHAVL